MDCDDFAHRVDVGKPDVVEKAAAQKRVGQFFFVVGCDDDDRAVARAHGLARLIDVEFHPVEFLQQVIGEFDVRFVDFIDQQYNTALCLKRLPQFAAFRM